MINVAISKVVEATKSQPKKCNTAPKCGAALAPAERHGARAVGAFLHEGLMKLATRPGVDRRPAVLAVVLQSESVLINNNNDLY